MRRRGTPCRRLLGLVPVSASQGGGGSPLLSLALPNCCALGFDRTQCGYSVSTPTARTLNPKIDSGVTDVTDSPPHATTRHAASSPAPACSCLGLAGGGEGVPPPPSPLLGLALPHLSIRSMPISMSTKYLNPKNNNLKFNMLKTIITLKFRIVIQ